MFDIFSIAALFGYAFFLRIVLPGIIWTSAMCPMAVWLTTHLFEGRWNAAVAIGTSLAVGLVLTWVVDLLRSQIYPVYEGRSLWIPWVSRKLQARLRRKVERCYQRAERERDRQSSLRKETWYWLRMFPIGLDGKPSVLRPTLLGNVMAAYEDYPLSRYGMDPVFYWYRVWLKLPESIQKEYSLVSAEAQWLVYTSVVLCVSAVLYFGYFVLTLLVRYFELPFVTMAELNSASVWPPGLLLLLSLAGSYLSYRFSISPHRRVGEYFKSIFDDFRGELKVASAPEVASEKPRYRDAWAYLQYGLKRCPNCNQYYPVAKNICPYCSGPSSQRGE